ncbi:MAG: type III-B CRISPR module-associated Cmr3 family protein [Bacteroidota bacterium]|nr:type III-B CRISPR module-associated Cmr3 family protein [Bacteroidota bacterium]
MNNTKKYLIKFTPLDSFFWGGEKTFGIDNENYFVKSRLFPQQTTILGTLRFEFLLQNDLMKETKDGLKINDKLKATKLIGNESFNIENESDNLFGKIMSISPVFMMKGNKHYFVKPFDEDLNLVFEKGNSLLNKNNNFVANYTNYKSKIEYKNTLKSKENEYFFSERDKKGKEIGAFIEKAQIGIKKNNTGATDDNSFFKLKGYGLNKGFSFATVIETENNLETLEPGYVRMGTNRNVFKTEIINDFEFNTKNIFKSKTDRNRVVLLSDTFVSEEIHEYYDFAKINSISFRNIKTKTDTNNFYAHPKEKTDISKSNKYNIIERSSVFYVSDENLEKFKTLLNQKYLQNIGYNCYETIKTANNEK